MGDDETQRWIKDRLMEQATHTATILNKLETGEARMCGMQGSLDEVIECTKQFPALKISVEDLEAAEEQRKNENVAKLRMKIEKQEKADAEKKAIWNDRIWNVCVKISTPLLIAGYVIYNLVADKT